MSAEQTTGFKTPEEMPAALRESLGTLLLILADNKRLLGIRYADWILGAPALEAGISCSAMAQDEWGHARILYAMLRDFGEDPDHLEHSRDAGEYRSAELLDEPADSWPKFLALNLLLDTALSIQVEALERSRFEPLHYKVSKLLDEERFHFEHARGWSLRVGAREKGRAELQAAFEPAWRVCLRWFGRPDDAVGHALAEAGIADADSGELRHRWLQKVGPVVHGAGLRLARLADGRWTSAAEPSWDGWLPETRRGPNGSGPDPDTLARVRGDRNRALLMD